MKKSKDKYACFQWIRDVRAEMNRDMENMTAEERVEYINARYEKAREGRPVYTLEESKRLLAEFLAEPEKPKAAKPKPKARKSRGAAGGKPAAQPAARRKTAKRLAHA